MRNKSGDKAVFPAPQELDGKWRPVKLQGLITRQAASLPLVVGGGNLKQNTGEIK